MTADERNLLELLIAHERAIKRLYEVFAATFVDHQEFWGRLAGDEQKHADRLGTLRDEPTIQQSLSRDSRLKPRAIEASIGYVEHQAVRAQQGAFSLLQALAVARDVESALLERQFSKLADLPSERIRSILAALVVETEGHREALVEAMDTAKR